MRSLFVLQSLSRNSAFLFVSVVAFVFVGSSFATENAGSQPQTSELSADSVFPPPIDDHANDEMGASPVGFSLGVHRRSYQSKIDNVDSGKGLMLAFHPSVTYKFNATSWYGGLGYYIGKSRFTGLAGDMGELYLLMGPTLSTGVRFPFYADWTFNGLIAVEALWLRGDVDINSQTQEFAQGSRRYKGGPGFGTRLQLAVEYQVADHFAAGIHIGYGLYRGSAEFDDGKDMVSRAKYDAIGLIYGLSLSFNSD